MTGSSMIASQLHQSVVRSGLLKGAPARRAWDWRAGGQGQGPATTSADVLKRLRLGLSRDLASLWLEQADNIIL